MPESEKKVKQVDFSFNQNEISVFKIYTIL